MTSQPTQPESTTLPPSVLTASAPRWQKPTRSDAGQASQRHGCCTFGDQPHRKSSRHAAVDACRLSCRHRRPSTLSRHHRRTRHRGRPHLTDQALSTPGRNTPAEAHPPSPADAVRGSWATGPGPSQDVRRSRPAASGSVLVGSVPDTRNRPSHRRAVRVPPTGGAEGTRTPDPHTASVVRYQLRHSPLLSPVARALTE
jgi:hypothetical protein